MDYLYVSSISQNRTFRYSLPGIFGRTSATNFGEGGETEDITRNAQGLIWVATGTSSMPLRCCDSSGNTVEFISSDVITSASGVTVDDCGKLWISNNEDGKIYCIELNI